MRCSVEQIFEYVFIYVHIKECETWLENTAYVFLRIMFYIHHVI